MLNPINAIKQLYQLDDSENHQLDTLMVEQNEQALGVQLPPLLYHYLLQLGNVAQLNSHHHQLLLLPIERLGDYVVIGKTCDGDGVWGIHQDDLNPKNPQSNPMVMMSRNFDAIEQSEIHWFAELPLAEFLLAQAIINGVNGGLTHHTQIYDFDGNSIPQDLAEKLAHFASEIVELRQPHERFFQADNYSVVMMIGLDDNQPTAFLIGSNNSQQFDDFIHQLSFDFTNLS